MREKRKGRKPAPGVGRATRACYNRSTGSRKRIAPRSGAIAQLGERIVRNDEVVSSILTSSTKTQKSYGFSGVRSGSVSAARLFFRTAIRPGGLPDSAGPRLVCGRGIAPPSRRVQGTLGRAPQTGQRSSSALDMAGILTESPPAGKVRSSGSTTCGANSPVRPTWFLSPESGWD
jgi:hypothetical protein